MSNLLELARTINQTLSDKTDINIRLTNQRRDLEARQIELIPINDKGEHTWPGSNDTKRDIAAARAYAADPTCQTIQTEINTLEERLALVENALATYLNERRALEWQIRARMIDALAVNVTTNGHGPVAEPVEAIDPGLHAWADEQADRALELKYTETPDWLTANIPDTPDHDPVADLEDIPF